jgi:hypothetical protein
MKKINLKMIAFSFLNKDQHYHHHNIIEIMENESLKFNRTLRSSVYTFRNVMIILLFKLNYNK